MVGSVYIVRRRWSIVLPLLGLALFLICTYQGIRITRSVYGDRHARYVYWASVRLDSDPLNRHPISKTVTPCNPNETDCLTWEPDYIWIEPGVLEKAAVLSALPAFAAGTGMVALLARVGISEVLTFFAVTPTLMILWFWLLGWFIDRWRHKRLVPVTSYVAEGEQKAHTYVKACSQRLCGSMLR